MSQESSTVFVIQQPRPKDDGWVPNFEPATKYGKLDHVFDSGDRTYADPTSAKKKALARLEKFNADRDFLLWSNFGDPASLWLTIMILVAKGNRRLRSLYWSRGKTAEGMSNENGFYFPVELDVSSVGR